MTIEEINKINLNDLEYIATCCNSDLKKIIFLYHHYFFNIIYHENHNGIYYVYIWMLVNLVIS